MERDSSEQLNELATALCKAQAEIQDAKKDGANPHLGRNYATLASVWDACREPLTKNGLSVVQRVVPGEPGRIRLETILFHGSGQYICGVEDLPLTKPNDPQAYGAALTYARRYGLSAMVGVCPAEDIDAPQPSGNGGPRTPQGQQRPFQPQQRPTGSERTREAVANTERPAAGVVTGGPSAPAPAEDLHLAAPGSQEVARCSECPKTLSSAQVTYSEKHFGRRLCADHQREAAKAA